MDTYTARVLARAQLAEKLRQFPDRIARAGLLEADLAEIAAQGRLAHEADREQTEQLTAIEVQRGEIKQRTREVFEREEALRDRMPMVIADLRRDGELPLFDFLSRLAFARFRYRDVVVMAPATDASPEVAAEVRRVERVAKEDKMTRLDNLAAYCNALTKPGREAIVARLAQRGLDATWLQALAEDAAALVASGRNTSRAAEATAREAAAVAAQRARWAECRRAIRAACQEEPELMKLLGAC